MGCFFAVCAVAMLRDGYYVGRNHGTRTGSKRYYRAGHPVSFWLLVVGFLLLAMVLIGDGVYQLIRPAVGR